ncbi:hypothetical protein CROQUDRAFT_390023 [Cronartium quercuum f. sp. fusiforme G11]|uniref:Uncharacterized protein n=1 Tax=Cronartium quercuum f. sp. fusiforme G11 TaxID=708437 RepID=A0A9P6T5M0_9BASI|nr:hypothetical protein CROQUDRAFT_390023 [Cronartium quercuum f. sp. fusiforme G11]
MNVILNVFKFSLPPFSSCCLVSFLTCCLTFKSHILTYNGVQDVCLFESTDAMDLCFVLPCLPPFLVSVLPHTITARIGNYTYTE